MILVRPRAWWFNKVPLSVTLVLLLLDGRPFSLGALAVLVLVVPDGLRRRQLRLRAQRALRRRGRCPLGPRQCGRIRGPAAHVGDHRLVGALRGSVRRGHRRRARRDPDTARALPAAGVLGAAAAHQGAQVARGLRRRSRRARLPGGARAARGRALGASPGHDRPRRLRVALGGGRGSARDRLAPAPHGRTGPRRRPADHRPRSRQCARGEAHRRRRSPARSRRRSAARCSCAARGRCCGSSSRCT